jgi:2-dehydropantoate 2-reductase
MHIVVFGAGGVGGYFGGRLAQAGEKVTFIARGAHLQALQSGGLQVNSIKGDFLVNPVTATDDPARVKDVDAVLLCVKTWQMREAAEAVKPTLKGEAFILPLENGVEAPALLAEIVGKEHVMAGLCRIASRIASPGHIQHAGLEPSIDFGELDNRPSSRAKKLLHAFQHAGFEATIPADINVAVWGKFLFISAVSGIGAVTRVPMGTYRSLPETRQLLESALQECYSVALAQGIHLPEESVSSTLRYIDTLPPGTIASMQRDIMEGRPSELEAQNGALVRMGLKHHVPTPTHEFIYRCLLPQENLARQQAA